jgi:glycerate dehydrogenase
MNGKTSGRRAAFPDFATVSRGDLDLQALESLPVDLVTWPVTGPGELAERIDGASIVITNKLVLDADVMSRAGDLELICLAATGTDNVDLEAAGALGIGVCNIEGYCTASVAQHVFAMLLSLTRSLAGYQALVHEGAWRSSPQFCLLDRPVRELTGLTLGIVGLGELGRAVATLGKAFGMRLLVAERPGGEPEGRSRSARVPLDELLRRSDVVSLHCPLTADTRGLIGQRALRLMKPGAILINTARGAIVDSGALAAALREGRIGGAGIDVLPEEPPFAGDPLLDPAIPNLILTPHVAWAARESRQRALDEITANIQSFLEGGRRGRVV